MTITWSHQDVEFLGPRILTSSDQTWSWIRSTLHHVSVTTFGRIEYFSQATARPLFWCPVGINHMYDRGRLKQRRNMIIVPSPEGLICVCYSSGCSGCSRHWQLTKAELKKKKKSGKEGGGRPDCRTAATDPHSFDRTQTRPDRLLRWM